MCDYDASEYKAMGCPGLMEQQQRLTRDVLAEALVLENILVALEGKRAAQGDVQGACQGSVTG